jgi:hypothetical protein
VLRMHRHWKIFSFKKFQVFDQTAILWRTSQIQAAEEIYRPPKRTPSTFFLFLWVIFACLEPNPIWIRNTRTKKIAIVYLFYRDRSGKVESIEKTEPPRF